MGYTAKHFVSLSDLTVQNLNEMELGIQEAHDDTEELDKRLTSLAIDISSITKDLNTLTQDSSAALQAIKDIDNILKQDEELSTVLKNYGTNFLSKDPQVLTDSELRNVYKNLCLTDYQFFKEVKLNGKQITGSTLEINYPEIDTSLNITSNNSVSNKAITQKFNTIESTFNYYTKTDVIYDHIFNTITSEMFLRQQEDQELKEGLENHTHNDMATKTFVRKEISLIPTPDVSGQINAHNLDKSAHPDIWEAINNMDLSDYALVNHNHDKIYSKLDHTHDYADSDHTHDYLPLNGGTLTGDLKVGDSSIGTNGYLKGTWLYTSSATELGKAPKDIAVIESGWIYKRSLANLKVDLGVPTDYAPSSHTHDYAPSSHTHDYLPLSGGTLTGTVTMTAGDFLARYVGVSSAGHETGTYSKVAILSDTDNGYIRYRTLSEMKSDLGVPTDYATSSHNHDGVYAPKTHTHDYATQSNIDTAISDLKTWLLGTGNADTIDTIKDIADIMEEHGDILDALANTYASKNHSHNNYLPLSGSFDDKGAIVAQMTGGIVLARNIPQTLRWQSDSASQNYYVYTRYDNNADEGLTFGTGNNKVSILFRTDGDTSSQWNAGTPTLHMKNNTVTINKVISGSKASYTLDVGGSIHGTTLYENGVSLASIYSTIHSHPYASNTHNHDSVYSKTHDHPYASDTHNHDSTYLKLSGGTMTGPLVLTGGDATSGVGNIQLSDNGQIIKQGTTSTLFGMSGGSLIVGSQSYNTKLRGKQTRPVYNDKDVAMYSDIPTDYATSGHNHDTVYSPIHSHDYVSLGTKTAATMNGTDNASMIVNVQDANLIPGCDIYAHVINMGGYSGGNYNSQIAMPYVNALTDSKMFIRTAKGSTWRDWREVITTGNIGSYAYPKTGGQLDGSMNIYSTGDNWGEGIRIHPSNNWAGVILCENSNSGTNGTSTNTWSIHNNEGTFGIYKNGSNSSATQYFRNENNQWAIKGDLATHFVKPVSNDTYSLGSTTNRFMQVVADEHVITQNGSSSVYWKINVDSNGNLVFKHS